MNEFDIDRLMRSDAARFEASSARASKVVAGVLARLPDRAPLRPSFLSLCLAILAPFTRLAVPMAAAAVLGVIVGQDLLAAQTPIRFAEMLTTASVDIAGL
ncbi:hypothetical protein [Magnetospirillum molischianum]|uniref:Uncharacterized protein n=1 Tax=Magnetospirillum molischianum DSM 120 TaxID=1150626 RepID=H8FNY1_MAGML|nr:hypothetical protein [Magnetospirillum molischianum]CCG40069.1 conserved hypothetical protein [Magnetospirillum molischianum DSM 120]